MERARDPERKQGRRIERARERASERAREHARLGKGVRAHCFSLAGCTRSTAAYTISAPDSP
eukprot:3563240-Rhodomonas_salina.1